MKKFAGLLLLTALPGLAFGVFSFPALAQTAGNNPSPIAMPSTDPAVAPEGAATESTGLVPLSELSSSSQSSSSKTAQTTKHSSRHKARHKKKTGHASRTGSRMRIHTAQISLSQLGYNPGPADGVMGSRTKAAVKAFQRDHHLRADGIIGPVTFNALIRETGGVNPMRGAANGGAPQEDFFATHPDYYGYYGPDYANPTALGSPQTIPSRYGSMEVDQQQNGQGYQYNVMLNGQSVFHADNQPSVINVSRTFNLANADAIVLTSYGNGDSVCPYKHFLLVVHANSSGVHEISNCTRAYQAFTENGILYISFPGERLNGQSSGDMWRYENGSLEKL
jgi:peptidoglycan hydrolase-like protein with peptidoglycan-binding domain